MPAGRPTTVTPKARKQYLKAIRLGMHRIPAARSAGTSVQALRRFIESDPAGEEFRKQCLEADAEAEIRLLGLVNTAADEGDVKAAQWLLAVKWPGRYSQLKHLQKEMAKLIAQLEVERERLRQQADAASQEGPRPAHPSDGPPL